MDGTHAPTLDTLTGAFLVSTRRMSDPRFAETVIYMCGHGKEGAMGLVVNKPSHSLTMAEILHSADLLVSDKPELLPPVYIGGPVEMASAFILYSSEYRADHQLSVSPTISLSRDKRVLADISFGRGPENYLFLMGYAGWGPGQLERELVEDGWLLVPAADSIIFDTDDDAKWKSAALRYGIDITTFDDALGYT
ncbi:MAG: YqgE/AlgH family protein [Desulfobulbaceae bacterium]|nr:YqgE/AlgH family protein [Desulfobulbaceae bacterium]